MGTKGTKYLGIDGGGTRAELARLDLPRKDADHEQAPKFRV